MNYSGSYRKLLGNARAAMLAAIEIYNKPQLSYRDEVVVILILNAWELLLKAVVSKSRQSIFYPKRRNEEYKTLGWSDAYRKAVRSSSWPADLQGEPVRANLRILALYRDNAVHYYNSTEIRTLLYSLCQTSVLNFKDLALKSFGLDITRGITWQLLPLAFDNPVDPVEFLRSNTRSMPGAEGRAVEEFLIELKSERDQLSENGLEEHRLLTIYSMSLQAAKSVKDADLVVNVDNSTNNPDAVIVPRRVDPNESYPLMQKHVVADLRAKRAGFNSHSFQAIVFKYDLRENKRYCWRQQSTGFVHWSREVVSFIRKLSDAEVQAARKEYGLHLRHKSSEVKDK